MSVLNEISERTEKAQETEPPKYLIQDRCQQRSKESSRRALYSIDNKQVLELPGYLKGCCMHN